MKDLFATRGGRRVLNGLGLLAVVALMAYALYQQHVVGLEACPLCIFQRVAMMALGAVFLVAALHAPRGAGARVYGGLGVVAALAGIGIAARHVYIQNLPADQLPACGAPLDVLLEINPLFDVVKGVLTGSGECAEVNWSFLGLSMPAWVLIWFVLLGALIAAANWKRLARPEGTPPT